MGTEFPCELLVTTYKTIDYNKQNFTICCIGQGKKYEILQSV
jgi:hypothetical protein